MKIMNNGNLHPWGIKADNGYKLKINNMAQQTAVEWLMNEIESKGEAWENVSIRRVQISIDVSDYLELKRQAKQMEKEQMVKFAEFVSRYPDKNKNYQGEMLHAKSKYDEAERTIDLLEQYYNETYGIEKF